jgi:hypothetical protein
MRRNIVGLLAVALMCVCGVAAATPIVYNVYISDGTETVSGTITTDGTIGVLAAGDITAWHLAAVGPQTFGPATGAGVECLPDFLGGCGLGATSSTLFSIGDPFCTFPPCLPLGQVSFLGPGGTSIGFSVLGIDVVGIEAGTCGPGCNGGYPLQGLGPIGATPEPGTFSLLGLALAGLGFARKRSRGRQSTAV